MATNGGTGLAAGAMVAGIRGSLPLQVLVFNHRYYVTAAVVISLLAFVYKGMTLPYPDAVLALEVCVLIALLIVEQGRLFLVSTGNLTELAGPTLWGMGLAVLSILMHVYCLQLQTYVLRLDQIVHGIALVLVGLEFILGGLTVPAFLSAATQF